MSRESVDLSESLDHPHEIRPVLAADGLEFESNAEPGADVPHGRGGVYGSVFHQEIKVDVRADWTGL